MLPTMRSNTSASALGTTMDEKMHSRHRHFMSSHLTRSVVRPSSGATAMPLVLDGAEGAHDLTFTSSTVVDFPVGFDGNGFITPSVDVEMSTDTMLTVTKPSMSAPEASIVVVPSDTASTENLTSSLVPSVALSSSAGNSVTTSHASVTSEMIGATVSGTASTQSLSTSRRSSTEGAVIKASTTLQTSLTASSSSSSSQYTATWLGTAWCHKHPRCKQEEEKEERHRGVIAGSVIGVIGFGVLVFAVVMLVRRRRRRHHRDKGIEGAAVWSDKSKTVSQSSTNHTKQESLESAVMNQTRGRSRERSPERLGQPGPAISTDGALEALERKTAAYPHSQGYNHNRSDSKFSNASSDPFRTPINEPFSQDRPTDSKIGLALSRYSTAEAKQQYSEQLFPINHTYTVVQDPPPPPTDHKRDSSLSARTAAKDPEEQPEICNARVVRTARRHSFTPRIINIVAGQSTSQERTSNNNDRNQSSEPGRRTSTRARSASPAKVLSAYSGSPAKLNAHFGIETWGMEQGRTSSERLGIDRAGSGSGASVRGRNAEVEREGHTSYPPTSYPRLGRTLSAVKRTIRAGKERAFSGESSALHV